MLTAASPLPPRIPHSDHSRRSLPYDPLLPLLLLPAPSPQPRPSLLASLSLMYCHPLLFVVISPHLRSPCPPPSDLVFLPSLSRPSSDSPSHLSSPPCPSSSVPSQQSLPDVAPADGSGGQSARACSRGQKALASARAEPRARPERRSPPRKRRPPR